MTTRTAVLPCVALCAALHASSANAEVRLGLGGDFWGGRGRYSNVYWYDGSGMFHLTLAVDGVLARRVSVGGRFGALITDYYGGYQGLGVPLDILIRASVGQGRVYLEGFLGPWIMFGPYDPVRIHAAFGFGLQNKNITFGVEVGYLSPRAIVGVRLGLRI